MSKRKRWIQIAVGLICGGFALPVLLLFRPVSGEEQVSVQFLGVTNDSKGHPVASFHAMNSTVRTNFLVRSELEVQQSTGIIASVIQLPVVGFLKPGEDLKFEVSCEGWSNPWRINFLYSGRFHRHERFVYEWGWKLQRKGLLPDSWSDMRWLPQYRTTNVLTEWVIPRSGPVEFHPSTSD